MIVDDNSKYALHTKGATHIFVYVFLLENEKLQLYYILSYNNIYICESAQIAYKLQKMGYNSIVKHRYAKKSKKSKKVLQKVLTIAL